MLELKDLAFRHDIENELYYGGGIETIYEIIGYRYRDKLIASNSRLKLSKKKVWEKIIEYLREKLVVKEQILLIDKSKCAASTQKSMQDKTRKEYEERKSYYGNSELGKEVLKCHLCDKTDHVSTVDFRGKKVIEYFACEKFAKMTPKERFELLQQKGFCRQCLNPGVKENTGFHKDSK